VKNFPQAFTKSQVPCHGINPTVWNRKIVIFFTLLSVLGCTSPEKKTTQTEHSPSKSKKAVVKSKAPVSDQNDAEDTASIGSLEIDTNQALSPEEVVLDSSLVFAVDTVDAEETELADEDQWMDNDSSGLTGEAMNSSGDDYDEELFLSEERLIRTQAVEVWQPDFKDEVDSVLVTIEERIQLEPEKPSKEIIVERWYSPVNFEGYKFNRKKLVLYGVGKNEKLGIHYYSNSYYLSLREQIFTLEESIRPRELSVSADSLLTIYLLKYENRL
jgi:hypothetical protein